MAERIDWTKYLVPRPISNQKPGVDPSTLTTTDFVTIPSVAEFKDQENLFRIKKTTAFADYLGASAYPYSSDRYWLRDSGVSTDGVYVQASDRSALHNGLAPSISLKLPDGYTLEQLTQQLGLTKQTTDDGKDFYQVTLGEYPQTDVHGWSGDDWSEFELSRQLNGEVVDNNFRCTGRLYTTNGSNQSGYFESRQNPEFEYRGQKYVHVVRPGGNDQMWFKVEPLKWWVRNFGEVASGKAKQLDLDCLNIVVASIPFHPGYHGDDLTTMWQNSMVRAFLNSADSRQLDGNPDYKIDGGTWDFTQSGFLQQALNMIREPIREYTIPTSETKIARRAFDGCQSLEKIIIPAHVKTISDNLFQRCHAQIMLDITNTSRSYTTSAFGGEVFKYIYVPKTTDAKWMVFSPYTDPSLKNDYWQVDYNYQNVTHFMDQNYRTNYIQLHAWKAKQQIKFIPPEFTLELFPASEMKNYFIHNNHKRWAELVFRLHLLDHLKDWQKTNSLTDLMKIYYALGGFSQHQGERDKALDYVLQHIANPAKYFDAALDEQQQAEMMGDDIHLRFSGLVLKGPYKPNLRAIFYAVLPPK